MAKRPEPPPTWWRLLANPEPQPGSWQMAVDEAILREVGARRSPPTVRLYRWARPTLSLGAYQPASAVDWVRIAERGYDVVRRPSGGRAVLHDAELTYSVILPEELPGLPAGILPSYRYLSQALLAGLAELGVKVAVHHGAPPTPASSACFAAPSWYELLADGRKLVGSAQVRRFGGLLQHGSILLELDEEALFSVLAFDGEPARQRARERFRRHATALDRVLRRKVEWNEVAEALVNGFESALGIRLRPGSLLPREEALARVLADGKYSTDGWTRARQDPFRERGGQW